MQTWTQQCSHVIYPHCGCPPKPKFGKPIVNMVGQQFGRLTVRRFAGHHSIKERGPAWLCQCSCGNLKTTSGYSLRKGYTTSCGCISREQLGALGRARRGVPPSTRLASGEASFRQIYRTYRRRGLVRGVFELSEEEFRTMTQLPCAYCGIEPRQSHIIGRLNGAYVYNGVDRVDPALGYTVANSVPCCGTCNTAKNDMSVDVFLAWARQVAQRSGG